jgi:Domain of unknown function (DUF4258)
VKPVKFVSHAEQMLNERDIQKMWAIETIQNPEKLEIDPEQDYRKRAFRRVCECGNRWLRVVYEDDGVSLLVITVFFDRNAGRSS